MVKLREIIDQQKEQAEAKVARALAKVAELRSALDQGVKELKAAEEELKSIGAVLTALEKVGASLAQPTIKQAVLETLKHEPDGLTALEILAAINSQYFAGKILRTSLSPQLSRLKDDDHKVTLRGNRWFLVGQEEPNLFTRKK